MRQKNKFVTLQNIYENPLNEGSFSSIYKLYKSGKKLNKYITLKDVKNFLATQDSYTLHKPTKKHFLTQNVLAPKPLVIISMDLIDVKNISNFNKGFNYLVLFVDVFSKYLTIIPIKNKNKESILFSLKTFFEKDENNRYSRIYSDLEGGLYSKLVLDYLKKNKKRVYSNSSKERKNSLSEIYIRTFKKKLYRYMTHYNTHTYIDALHDIVTSINRSSNRSLKNANLTPEKLHKIKDSLILQRQFKKMFIRKEPKKKVQLFKIGDIVRIPRTEYTQSVFFKKYNILNTEEIFKIINIKKDRFPFLYILEDLGKEKIQGSFYAEELTKSSLKTFYPIKILKSRIQNHKKQFYVTWLGFPSSFNSWIGEGDVVSYNVKKK